MMATKEPETRLPTVASRKSMNSIPFVLPWTILAGVYTSDLFAAAFPKPLNENNIRTSIETKMITTARIVVMWAAVIVDTVFAFSFLLLLNRITNPKMQKRKSALPRKSNQAFW